MLVVETRLAGRKQRPLDRWSVPIPPSSRPDGGEGGLTLRDLIAAIVRKEVHAYEGRQRARRLVQVLSEAEIEVSASRGRVDSGGREGTTGTPDVESSVEAALEGFEDGLYVVLLDDKEMRELDAQVYLGADSRLTFLRLVFLAGA